MKNFTEEVEKYMVFAPDTNKTKNLYVMKKIIRVRNWTKTDEGWVNGGNRGKKKTNNGTEESEVQDS